MQGMETCKSCVIRHRGAFQQVHKVDIPAVVFLEEAFGVYDQEGCFRIYPTRAEVFVGGHGPDARSEQLTEQKVQKLTLMVEEKLYKYA